MLEANVERKKECDVDRDDDVKIMQDKAWMIAPSRQGSEETGDSLPASFVLKMAHDEPHSGWNYFNS